MSAEVAYLDASAAVKLLVREAQTAALRRRLRSLHLATALSRGNDPAAVTYDSRMSAAARALGLPVIAPR